MMRKTTNTLESAIDVRRAAMDLLARREHSFREISRKLSLRVVDDALLENVLVQMVEEGLLSDSRFAETYVRYRSSKGFGPVRIAAELRDKGIAEDLLRECVSNADEKWYQLAAQVKQKKFGLEIPAAANEKAKQIRFLLNRGFVRDQINAAVEGELEVLA